MLEIRTELLEGKMSEDAIEIAVLKTKIDFYNYSYTDRGWELMNSFKGKGIQIR